MNRLVLIDGNAILHRAYHALPPLTAPDGQIVNAVYGFVSILIKLFQDLKPTHMAVAFDRPEKTFRKSLYKDYQGKRPEMDADLATQIPKVQDMVRAFGIPIYDKAGYEADDVIGTVCQKAISNKQKVKSKTKTLFPIASRLSPNIDEVIIVTGDKDILQLVDDKLGVKVFMPTKGLSEGKLYGEAEVVERLGVTPKQIPELKALMGDSSDNYPGVVGIGPKTAVGIIGSFRTIEKMYEKLSAVSFQRSAGAKKKLTAHSFQLSAGVIEKLVKGEKMARMSKDLATIRTDVPIEMKSLEPLETLDTPQAREKLSELHFGSLLKRLTGEKEEKEKEKEREEKVEKKKDGSQEKVGEQQELF